MAGSVTLSSRRWSAVTFGYETELSCDKHTSLAGVNAGQ